MICTIAGCGKPHKAKGYCASHSQNLYRLGHAETAPRSLEERFWEKVDRAGPDDCWIWKAHLQKGYGALRVGPASKGKIAAHQFAYTQLVGPIPDGMELDHLCRNRRCVNPRHLEPVTHAENIRRANIARDQASGRFTR